MANLYQQIVAGVKQLSSVIAASTVSATKFFGAGSAPTGAFGTGAGTSPTGLTIAGTDAGGLITFTTGTVPTASAVILTLTFNTTGVAPKGVLLYPSNSAAGLTNAIRPFTTSLSTSGWAIQNCTGQSLTASTQFMFSYIVIW